MLTKQMDLEERERALAGREADSAERLERAERTLVAKQLAAERVGEELIPKVQEVEAKLKEVDERLTEVRACACVCMRACARWRRARPAAGSRKFVAAHLSPSLACLSQR